MTPWVTEISRLLTFAVLVGGGLVWAADQRYALSDDLLRMKLMDLQREETYLDIKVQQGEATTSEKIYLKTIVRDIQEMKQRLEK